MNDLFGVVKRKKTSTDSVYECFLMPAILNDQFCYIQLDFEDHVNGAHNCKLFTRTDNGYKIVQPDENHIRSALQYEFTLASGSLHNFYWDSENPDFCFGDAAWMSCSFGGFRHAHGGCWPYPWQIEFETKAPLEPTSGLKVSVVPNSMLNGYSSVYMRYSDILVANEQGVHYLAAIEEINNRQRLRKTGSFIDTIGNALLGAEYWSQKDRRGSWDIYGEFNPLFSVEDSVNCVSTRSELLHSVADPKLVFDTLPLCVDSDSNDSYHWCKDGDAVLALRQECAFGKNHLRKPSSIIHNLGASLNAGDVCFETASCHGLSLKDFRHINYQFSSRPCMFSYATGINEGVSFPTVSPTSSFDFDLLNIPVSNVLAHPQCKNRALRHPDTNFDFSSLNQYQGAITYIEIDGKRSLAMIVPSVGPRRYSDTSCRDDLHVYCPRTQFHNPRPTGICQVEEYGSYDVYAVDSMNPTFATKLLSEVKGQDVAAMVSKNQEYRPMTDSEAFKAHVELLQTVISKHTLFGDLATEQALGMAGYLEQVFQTSVERLRRSGTTETDGLDRYTAEAVAKLKGEFLFDLTEHARNIQFEEKHFNTVKDLIETRDAGMTAISDAYRDVATELRKHYEEALSELGEVRDAEFERLMSAYEESADKVKADYMSHGGTEQTDAAISGMLGSSSVSEYVDAALMTDSESKSSDQDDSQFQ